MKSCLICDDHVLVREALVGAVRQNWPDAVITEVGDFQSGWAAAPGHDLCITDLIMPGAGPREGVTAGTDSDRLGGRRRYAHSPGAPHQTTRHTGSERGPGLHGGHARRRWRVAGACF